MASDRGSGSVGVLTTQKRGSLTTKAALLRSAAEGSPKGRVNPMTIVKTLISAAAALVMSVTAHAANIVETADSAGQFKTLLAAAKAAGLADDLSGPGPFTVFAPTDAAFAKLGKKTIADLLKPENREQLATILKYHVIAGEVKAADVPRKATVVATLAGEGANGVRVRRNGNGVRVDSARVIKADIQTDNGVIHVINRVLIPGKRH
jgi:uncharacterized surface protein with fasciclin (FAS1) repeats